MTGNYFTDLNSNSQHLVLVLVPRTQTIPRAPIFTIVQEADHHITHPADMD